MNGIVNGYQIKHEVRKNQIEYFKFQNWLPYFLLAEVRPYSFIIPPPYLVVDNDDEMDKDEWKIIDEKRNDTDDDDDDAVKKRIVLFICIYVYVTIW